jgi:hypothetical protein
VKKCLEGYLRCFVSDKQTQCFKWLPLAEWWYNTSFHTATKMTPFMALYGYHPPSITSSLKEKSKVQVVARSHRESTTNSPNLKGQPEHGTESHETTSRSTS